MKMLSLKSGVILTVSSFILMVINRYHERKVNGDSDPLNSSLAEVSETAGKITKAVSSIEDAKAKASV